MKFDPRNRAVRMSVLGLIGVLACCTSQPREMSEREANDLYMERFNATQDRSGITGVPAYEPVAIVRGSTDGPALSRLNRQSGAIPKNALAEARAYAAANNSSAFIVWLDGTIEEESYFQEFSQDSLIVSKSLAKPLGVIAVGRAIEEGYIQSLDQPASDFIQEWRGTPKEEIPIRYLLDMRSGLLPQAPAPDAEDVLNLAYLHPFHDRIIINEYPLTHEPGARYEYSNANAELVAPLIERATGKPYEDWVSEDVLNPIRAPGGEIWMNRKNGTPHAGCCVMLPAETYLRLGILLIEDGIWEGTRLLPEGFVTQMRTPTEQNPHAGMAAYIGSPYIERRGAANPELEIGKTLHSEPYQADDLFLFDGNSNQVVYIVPSKRLVILRTGDWPPKEPEWDNAALPNIILRALSDESPGAN